MIIIAAALIDGYDDVRMAIIMMITVFISSQYISGTLYT